MQAQQYTDEEPQVAHIFQISPTGRAKCRGCGVPIPKDEVRFGERIPNPFGSGEATLWFHPRCGAYRRPESFLEALPTAEVTVEDAEALSRAAQTGIEHPNLPRLDKAVRSPSGRASCRSCRELIPKGEWRVGLVLYQEGMFAPGGYIHLTCVEAYFETPDVMDRIAHFSDLTSEDLAEIREATAKT